MFEPLESRRLMTAAAATVGLENGVLTVNGSKESERIAVFNAVQTTNAVVAAGQVNAVALIVVSVDGKTLARFKTNTIKSIVINANGGNDRVSSPLENSVLRYGPGNDRLTGLTPKNVRVDGGSGNDRIAGGSGDDVLLGGAGNDILADVFGADSLDGGAGDDSLTTRDDQHDNGPIYLLDRAASPDTLTGGTGVDTFYTDGDDTVTDPSVDDILRPTVIV